ncbi:MAG TPA: VCBS repeat-containing protein, partial [Nitrospirales bacterium]|nr:VCBS repeat-containing protein [Nitrospirales bacterium]
HAVQNADYVHTWTSNGNGTFNVGTFRPWKGYGIPNGIWLTADINGDGKTDIVHAVQNADYVHTWTSNGNGTFNVGTFRPWKGYGIPNGKWLTADLNGDGKTDIVHVVQNADYMHTWMSNGNGTFNVGTFRPWVGYRISNGVWLSEDFSNDNRTDLVHVYQITPGRPLEVSRFNTSTLTNADADRILDDATRVVWRNDGPGDISCAARLYRNGNVTVFNNGNGTINSQADFNTINGLAGRVKVVNQINWCSGLIPNVIGCAPVPGNSQIVVRFTANQEGILWAHEYGHTRGLNHVTGTTSIMNGTIDATRTMLTQNECNSLDN